MDAEDDGVSITITHYVNPHMFWYKNESILKNPDFFSLDNQIQSFFFVNKGMSNVCYKPQLDELVAVFNIAWNRWIRGKVDNLLEMPSGKIKYSIWAIDHGMPLETDSKWIRKLPAEFANVELDLICFGGLSKIVPAQKVYSFENNCTEVVMVKSWSSLAISTMEKIIGEADSIKFYPELKTIDGQFFGQLKVLTHTNISVNATTVLLEINAAKNVVQDFFKVLRKIGTNKVSRTEVNGNKLLENRLTMEVLKYRESVDKLQKSKPQCDYETENKVNDWETRNQKCLEVETMSALDDEFFDESASMRAQPVAKTDGKVDKKPNEIVIEHEQADEDSQMIKLAGTSRKMRLEKYRKSIPRPPIDSLQKLTVTEKKSESIPDVVDEKVPQKEREIVKEVPQKPIEKQIQKEESPFVTGTTPKSSDNELKRGDNSSQTSSGSGNKNTPSAIIARLNKRKKSAMSKVSSTLDTAEPAKPIYPAGHTITNADLQDTSRTKKKTEHFNDYLTNNHMTANAGSLLNNIPETCVQSNLTKHLVLVHGKHIAKPIDKLANANFCAEVHTELAHMRFLEIYRIQAHTWPHLMRGNSLVVVNSARTGKTQSYLPAICSLIKMKFDEEESVPEGVVGPVGIIVVSSSVEVENITRTCKRFFDKSTKKPRIVKAFGKRDMQKVKMLLLGCCEILVITTPCLARLLREDIKYFSSSRLQHLVIDNIDLINNNLIADLQLIIGKCCRVSKERRTTSVQLVVTSRIWSSRLEGFFKMCSNPQLCIGSYIEAAVYMRSQMSMHIVKQTSKYVKILDFLKKHSYQTERLVIICNKDEEVSEVELALKASSSSFISCSGQSNADEIAAIMDWHKYPLGKYMILVCTDSVLHELKVFSAQNMISYSLPSSWTKFVFRYSVFLEYYENPFQIEKSTKPPARSLILLDENNNSQLPKLVEFFELHDRYKIPSEIKALSQKIKIQREEQRIATRREFCPSLMEFGNCKELNDCKYRHDLTKYDVPETNIPSHGKIKVKILNVFSPIHYCARLMEYQSLKPGATWEKIKHSDRYLKFNFEFSQHFTNSGNHIIHWPINIDDLCVVVEDNVYYRCKVLEISQRRGNKSSEVNLKVKLVDTGLVMPCKSSTILALPEKFKEFPFQAIDLRLVGISPQDFEEQWDSKAKATAQNWIEKHVKLDFHVEANIRFALMNTIWIDSLSLVQSLKMISTHIQVFEMKNQLVSKEFAILNNLQVEIIENMAKECGLFDRNEVCCSDKSSIFPSTTDESFKSLRSLSSTETDFSTASQIEAGLSGAELLGSFSSGSVENSKSSKEANRSKRVLRYSTVPTICEAKTSLETWATLPENDCVHVYLGAFYTPFQFYVQNLEILNRLEDLYDKIEDYAKSPGVALVEPQIGLPCLAVLDGKYNRAKVTKFYCDDSGIAKMILFFCDIGLSQNFDSAKVIPTPDNLIKLLPYQAIRCKMTGIQPLDNGIWSDELCDKIYDEIIDPSEYLYVRRIKLEDPYPDSELKLYRHEVVLINYTTEKDIKLNKVMVDAGFCNFDPETRHFLDLITNVEKEYPSDVSSVDSMDETNWDNFDYKPYKPPPPPKDDQELQVFDFEFNFTQEECIKLLNLPPTAKFIPPPKKLEANKREIVEIKHDDEPKIVEIKDDGDESQIVQNVVIGKPSKNDVSLVEVQSVLEQNNCKDMSQDSLEFPMNKKSDNAVDTFPMPRLIRLCKVPDVTWQQSESLICLNISAVDIKDYYLKVTSSSLVYMTLLDEKVNPLVINLFGCVDPELTSHELRGLNVIVRLSKSLKGISWPRLTTESDKHMWLKTNYDAIILDEETILNTDLPFNFNARQIEYADSTSSEEQDYGGLRENELDKAFELFADEF